MSSSANQVRSLYRKLLRQGNQFAAYNFREYAVRRTKDAFRQHVAESDSSKIQELLSRGNTELQMLKRQTVVSQFFQLDRLVVEGGKTGKQTGNKGDIVRQTEHGLSSLGSNGDTEYAEESPDAEPPENVHQSRRRAFRAGGRSNRSGRSQADHDVFEGLPVRQWHQSESIVGLPPPTEVAQTGDNAWPELPMPRDSAQLAPWTQQLLREARRPRLAKRPQEPTEDDKPEEEDENEAVQTGWQSKKWSQVPSHLEKPEREFLAKRRKGLPSLHTQIALQAANAAASSAPTRRTKVMKSDADGNTTVYEVLVPEGQTVEGEVVDDTVMADAAPVQAAPGTVIEGVGIANAEGVIVATDLLQQQQQPMRRKPIPPRRIRKGGPGRGKKKVMFNPDDGHNAAATSTPGGGVSVATPSTLNANADDSAMDIDSTPKPDANDNDDNDNDNEEGDEEDGEEGEEGDEDDDREDGELSDGEDPQVTEQEPVSGLEETVSAPANVEIEVEADEPTVAAVEEAQDEPTVSVVEEAQEVTQELVGEAQEVTEAPMEITEEPATIATEEEADEQPVAVTSSEVKEAEIAEASEPQEEALTKKLDNDTKAGSERSEEDAIEKDTTMKDSPEKDTTMEDAPDKGTDDS
ncbi:hypothetical protein D6D28_02048 [Aureobasidium pullulans]|uniref:Complex 1 LYR protein domain-containing protein n=1 Tax=Aureobasidium pullulans TaxID=5580 RepID=A0A4S8SVZ0_AURPU|nr:hypothetical protein D6D28_02048 [Aureobasidium pullulans]